MRRPVVRMSGLSSTTTSRARPATGPDVLVCPRGSLLRASRSSGSACGTLRERSTTGTGKHVSVLGTSLLFLLADGLRGEGLSVTSWCAVPSEVKVATFIRTCWRTRAVLCHCCWFCTSCCVSFDCPCPWRFHRCSSWTRCYAPRCCVWCRLPDSALLCSFHRYSSWTKSFKFPVVVQRLIPMVFCSEDHNYSPVAPQHGDR